MQPAATVRTTVADVSGGTLKATLKATRYQAYNKLEGHVADHFVFSCMRDLNELGG